MLTDSARAPQTIVRLIELRGHILDSGIFSRVLGILTDYEQTSYVIEEFDIGQTKDAASYARVSIEARDPSVMGEVLDKLRDVGVTVLTDHDVRTGRNIGGRDRARAVGVDHDRTIHLRQCGRHPHPADADFGRKICRGVK